MSASQRTNQLAIPQSHELVTTQSLLNFDQILDLLNQGLIEFIACFAENDDRSKKFKASFATSLVSNPLDKKNFNQYGILLIKAAYPRIFQLTMTEKDNLQKLGILHVPQIPADSEIRGTDVATMFISQFFRKEIIEQFIRDEIKEKYKEEILNLVNLVYKFIVTATCSIACEQILVKHDINSQPIKDKNVQKSIYSGLDLQLGNAKGNLKTATDKLLHLKTNVDKLFKTKTSKMLEINKSIGKMDATIAKATTEYANNNSEQKAAQLKEEGKAMALAANIAQLELDSVRAQLEEERRKAQELIDQKQVLERVAQEKLAQENFDTTILTRLNPETISQLKITTKDTLPPGKMSIDSPQIRATHQASSPPIDSTSISSKVSHPASPLQHVQTDIEEHKEMTRAQAQQRVEISTEMVLEEAKISNMNIKTLGLAFKHLMAQLSTPHMTEASVLRSLIIWEKAAFSYIENHKSEARISTAIAQKLPVTLLSVFSFIGRKTGMGKMKTVDPSCATALKNELGEILKQCIILAEQDRNLNDSVKILNQHLRYMAMHHTQEALDQGTVSQQLMQIVEKITRVATDKFHYQPAASNTPEGGMI
jgi:hypothetical protein